MFTGGWEGVGLVGGGCEGDGAAELEDEDEDGEQVTEEDGVEAGQWST